MTDQQNIKILNDREHVLLRSGMYIGSTKPEKQTFWIPTKEGNLTRQEITYIPGLFKIFNEILDNSIDEICVRGYGDTIRIEYDKETGFITIGDNGRGIPIDIHNEAKVP